MKLSRVLIFRMNDDRRLLLSYEDLRALGLPFGSRWTLSRWIKARKFPAPVKLGRRVAWRRDEVENWIKQKLEERNGQSPDYR